MSCLTQPLSATPAFTVVGESPTPTTTPSVPSVVVEPSPAAVVEELLARLRSGDFDRIEELLAPDVWLRALLVRVVHESSTAKDAVAALASWVGGANGSRMLDGEHAPMAGRHFLRYRFEVRPRWAPEQWHVIEQSGYCKVAEGRIRRLDLVCTGYFPVADG